MSLFGAITILGIAWALAGERRIVPRYRILTFSGAEVVEKGHSILSAEVHELHLYPKERAGKSKQADNKYDWLSRHKQRMNAAQAQWTLIKKLLHVSQRAERIKVPLNSTSDGCQTFEQFAMWHTTSTYQKHKSLVNTISPYPSVESVEVDPITCRVVTVLGRVQIGHKDARQVLRWVGYPFFLYRPSCQFHQGRNLRKREG